MLVFKIGRRMNAYAVSSPDDSVLVMLTDVVRYDDTIVGCSLLEVTDCTLEDFEDQWNHRFPVIIPLDPVCVDKVLSMLPVMVPQQIKLDQFDLYVTNFVISRDDLSMLYEQYTREIAR
jgi:hypothetical protein